MNSEAFIVEAVRTPAGRRNGSLAEIHPLDLGAEVLIALIDRSGALAETVEQVIFGYVDAIGPQADDIARLSWLAAGFPHHVPGVTVDRQCGSSQQAVHFAAQAVRVGDADLVVAGGVQHMSRMPIMSSYTDPLGDVTDLWSGSKHWEKQFSSHKISEFVGAEMMADRWGISRSEMEQFAAESHRRAIESIDTRLFDMEIVPVAGLKQDETAYRDTSTEKMAALKPLRKGGKLTAAVSGQVCDGASAVLIASEAAVKRYGLRPRARIVHMSTGGGNPVEMLSAPIEATRIALAKARLSIEEIDTVEINEAFSSVVLAWLKEFDIDPTRVNPRGGAIALGHPLAATGTKLMTTLLHELERTGGRYGLQTMCEGGGRAKVTIVERMP
ncbi:acetyl-CoA C-acyltransferase (plasmid) [Rhodococcus erythropolis]|uniref:acetyl-CoA C-acyltransferase n=1 Tax=Rhodococcus erythropolis TaxID=1833 RepID=UPI00406BB550